MTYYFMNDFFSSKGDSKPIYIHYGTNIWRYLLLASYLFLLGLGAYSLINHIFTSILLMLASLLGIAFIGFPRVEIYADRYEKIKNYFLSALNTKETIVISTIEEITYTPGDFSMGKYVLSIFLGSSILNGRRAYDRIYIKTKNNETIVLYRFGSRKNFKALALLMQENLPITSSRHH